jgi:hypothetical protein
MSSYISFSLIDSGDEKAIDNVSKFLLNQVPHSFDSIKSSPNKIAIAIAKNLSKDVLLQKENILYEYYDQKLHNFNVDISEILAGDLFDTRQGLSATILEYEDVLNKRIIRNRLQSLSPNAFLTHKAND